ncbi:single-stranded-DNA-specific exonuclease RecJ [Lederbergia lenta]|uniref:Single-stranded-DNA-specific exonuclease RecJ n=1 Tax=Lederbergia lenta TaxID=1467 RepID=A0A2X4VZH9_LEDLE|nr:single-stranded-DNA-specific exonuclease RecJ [Lederbergia lenta]MCM3111303.1 single-stranded-DNA-specific exonuclease RecJ [Lederbergia lenta]MEC2325308.1 single-stranded-DNA-specific exonuclease RecJ [Lederbergia lenta]SQI55829.1 single-stranded-DNA-specific exonuclease RecJ [Lederbergia lenta]
MLYSKTRWSIRETNDQTSKELAKQLNIAPLVATLLVNRGMDNIDTAKEFLFPEKEAFHDPFLFEDMSISTSRIKKAIEKEEPILIFGDYDADGVTSTSILMTTLQELGANVSYYIPNRFTEGYGPNEKAFRKVADEGIKLIITVDNGIAALHEAKVAKELGMDLIITDHHEPGPELPDAYAIIHPKLPGTKYPFSDLAGAGVAFKLAHALLGDDVPTHLLDLATIGTIADLVPLHGENRLIAKKGLKNLSLSTRPGLKALCKVAGANLSEVNEETVGFAIAPRLNAVGRLEHAGPAVELLMTQDITIAEQLSEEIDLINKERKAIVEEIEKEAINIVEAEYPADENSVLVIGKEGWNAGVIGIVASRLVERYYRPIIMLSYDYEAGLAKGSARSIKGFDLFKNLSTLSNLLPHFGGHPMAAGMTLDIKNVNEFRIKLNDAATQQLSSNDFIPVTELDASIALNEVSIDTIHQLDMLAPYGMKNPKPKVLIADTAISGVRKIGSNKNHLKLTLEKEGHALDGVGFNLGNVADEISPGSKVSVIGELSINEWNNMRKPQIFLKDIAVKEWQLFDMRGNNQLKQRLSHLPKLNCLNIVFDEGHLKSLPATQTNTVLITDVDQAKKMDIDDKSLVLLDLPSNINVLKKLVDGKNPARIYACFIHDQGEFFDTLPTRDHFKWFYAFLLKRQTFDVIKHGADLASYRGWTKETINFMSKVFFELNFVTIKDGLIIINPVKTKQDLTASPTYQQKQEQLEIENILLYSSYEQLKLWFNDRLAQKALDEEEMEAWI